MKKIIFAFVLLFAVFLYAEPQKIERFLMVVGANDGGANRVKLRYAENDANSFAGVMYQMGGVDKSNVLRVFSPNVKAMQNGFAELENRLRGKEAAVRKEVIVYYSGHASEKGLCLGDDVYSWAEFRQNVNNINADVKVAILDACGSGAITRTKGGVSRPAFLHDASSEIKGYAFLTSSNENEASQESDRIKGSFFTHALVGGLRGAADMTGNGKVTLSEAYQYAFDETIRNTENTSAGSQHPNRDMNMAGTGDIVMTDLRETDAVLALDSNLAGRLFIRDEYGNLFVELNKIYGRRIEIGMPPGKYSVRMETHSKTWMASEMQIFGGKKNALSIKDMKNIEKNTTVARGDADLVMTSLDSARAAAFKINPFGFSDVPENSVQIGFVTYASRALVGTQISVVGNLAADDMVGCQFSAGLNIANNIYGGQGAGSVNIAKSFTGIQAAPINIAINGKGIQAGVINVAASVDKMQIGVLNVGGYVGRQINVAASVDKMQIGVLNVGGYVGRQIGVINIIEKSDKTPIGVISIMGNGIIDGTFYSDETGRTGIAMHTGTPYFYTILEYAFKPIANGEIHSGWDDKFPQSSGYGFGTRFGKWGNFFNLEYVILNTYDKPTSDFSIGFTVNDYMNYLQKLRFGGGYKFLPGFALSGGITLNILSESGDAPLFLEPLGKYHWQWTVLDSKVRVWPGLYAGLTVGRF